MCPWRRLAPLGVEDVTIENKNQTFGPKARLGLAAPLHTALPLGVLASHLAKKNQGRAKEISRSAQSVVAAPLALSWERRLSERSHPMSKVHQLYAQKAAPTWSELVATLNDPYLIYLIAIVLFCLFCLISLLLTAVR